MGNRHKEVASRSGNDYGARMRIAIASDHAALDLKTELRNWVRTEIGPIASPDYIQWAPGLPKTRSGKIMRRILRKIAENDYGALGDTSTLADPSVVDELIANRKPD